MTAYHDTHIPYLATLALDTALLIPFLVFAVILGQPLSLTTCSDLPKTASHVALPISTLPGKPVSYIVFSGAGGQAVCYELMAVWGLMIALSVLFATSAVSAGFLFVGKRRGLGAAGGGGGMGGGEGGGHAMNESQIEMAHGGGGGGGKGFVSRSPSLGPSGSAPSTRPVSPGSAFDGPMPPRGPPQRGFEPSSRGSFDDASPPMRR